MALEPEDLSYLKEIFVQKDDCNRTVAKEHEEITELKVLLAKSNTKLTILIGIISAIAVPLISICAKMLFGN